MAIIDDQTEFNNGTFVVAVSGGVDSVVLLDLLVKNMAQSKSNLIVAHFDHGIRDDSAQDAEFVKELADKYQLKFELGQATLGPNASEDLARQTRYHFLDIVKQKHSAKAIITAHHQDDLIETMFINIARGTGRKGLSSLKTNDTRTRPLLKADKQHLINYAKAENLSWREDTSNNDQNYLRNHIRAKITPKLTPDQRQRLIDIYRHSLGLNQKIDQMLEHLIASNSHKRQLRVINRQWFNKLDHKMACEVIHHLFGRFGVGDYSHRLIDETVVKLKTLRPGKKIIIGDLIIELTKRSIRFRHR